MENIKEDGPLKRLTNLSKHFEYPKISNTFNPDLYTTLDFPQINPNESRLIITHLSPFTIQMTIDNEKKMNHLSLPILEQMLEQLKKWEKGVLNSPKVVIMEGKGSKAFCSGGDMRGLYDGYTGKMPKYCGTLYKVDYALYKMKPIHICIWNGFVFGSGAGICASANFKIATEKSEWAMPECVAGFLVDNATSIQFTTLKGDRAKYLCLGLYLAITGKRVIGKDLLRYGIATHFVSGTKIEDMKKSIIQNVNEDTDINDVMNVLMRYSDNSALREDPENYDIIYQIFKPDSIQNIFDRVYQYPDQNHSFIIDTKQYLEKNSPMSMAICFELLIRGQRYTKQEALIADYKVGQALLNYPDYFHGVHKLLVDKDRNTKPKWHKKSVYDITNEDVEYFFNYQIELNLD